MTKPWYVTAFGEHYGDLYHHRNEEDARRAIEFLYAHEDLDPGAGLVLDLCCGSGRHCLQWIEQGHEDSNIVGLDLSAQLLGDATRAARSCGLALPLLRGDMRRLPFTDGIFRLVLNLFTSFGYFDTEEENAGVFDEVARVLVRPGGYFVFDHMNPARLRTRLVSESSRTTPSGACVIERRSLDLERRRVEKDVELRTGGRTLRIRESVRYYERREVEAMAARCGLRLKVAYGDFDDSPLAPDSPRAVYVLET